MTDVEDGGAPGVLALGHVKILDETENRGVRQGLFVEVLVEEGKAHLARVGGQQAPHVCDWRRSVAYHWQYDQVNLSEHLAVFFWSVAILNQTDLETATFLIVANVRRRVWIRRLRSDRSGHVLVGSKDGSMEVMG